MQLCTSIVIPVFNGAKHLAGAIESALAQTLPPDEIIVVDDGSTDDTPQIVKGFGSTVRYLHQANAGASAARNRGYQQARGQVIGFLDADDAYLPDALEHALIAFHLQPEAELVHGMTQVVLEAKDGVESKYAEPWRSCQLGSAFYRRSAFSKIGEFDGQWQFGEDLDWFLRARQCGLECATVDRVFVRYRLHETNMTRGKNLHDQGLLRVLKAAIDRRRAA